jgi:hypothetical protein
MVEEIQIPNMSPSIDPKPVTGKLTKSDKSVYRTNKEGVKNQCIEMEAEGAKIGKVVKHLSINLRPKPVFSI